ncbi:MAG: glucosylceramidase [Lentisphaeria bacterium]|nr:glucosylceramidase [Lentisphaeria bacterium]
MHTPAPSEGWAAPGIPPQAWLWDMTREPECPLRPAHARLSDGGHWQGLPLGGMGAGGIGRNYRGAFGRWTLKAGCLQHFCEPANMFAARQCPAGRSARAVALHPGYPTQNPAATEPARRSLGAWEWTYAGQGARYAALFPKAWYQYPAEESLPVAMTCEQFSPLLPHNYRESSYPLALFVWRLHNTADVPVDVSLLFSFVNMNGWFAGFSEGKPQRRNAGNRNRPFAAGVDVGQTARGILLERRGAPAEAPEGVGQWCLAALESETCEVTFHTAFDPRGDGSAVWGPFARNGRLDNEEVSEICAPQQEIAAAVCARVAVPPGGDAEVVFALAWDLPVIAFGSGRRHRRRYTRFFSAAVDRGAELAREGFRHWCEWSAAIDAWHAAVIARHRAPPWYHTLLFNETYLLVDGLTVWTDGTCENPGADPFFAVIECPDYPYYCTLDLWVYGSFPVLLFWPELEKDVMRRFAAVILSEDPAPRRPPRPGPLYPAKLRGAAPHDFGEPHGDPPFACNAYGHQDSNRWKDLNCQFVLALCRDARTLDDPDFLDQTWPAARAAMEYLERFDADGDGLIENDGTPDQTMDNIPMTGPSSYCGGLWLAALHAALDLAQRTGDTEFLQHWGPRAAQAREAFDRKLWDGRKYRLDTAGPFRNCTFLDGLFGIWYGHLCGLGPLLPPAHHRSALEAVWESNVAAFHDGQWGGRNVQGMDTDAEGGPETAFATRGCQVEEVLSGLNMSFAAQLLALGMAERGMTLLHTLYDVIYQRCGLWFRTPAAWTADGRFRAIMNLRPLVIWAIEFQQEQPAPETRREG